MSIQEKMEADYLRIIDAIKAGEKVSSKDLKFAKSYANLKKSEAGLKADAGNAGKRKAIRTGK